MTVETMKSWKYKTASVKGNSPKGYRLQKITTLKGVNEVSFVFKLERKRIEAGLETSQ